MRYSNKPVGWRNDSYRHYLAAKGVSTKNRYFYPDDKQLMEYVAEGEKPAAEFAHTIERENDAKQLGLVTKKVPLPFDRSRSQLFVAKDEESITYLEEHNDDMGSALGYPEKSIKGFKSVLKRGRAVEDEEGQLTLTGEDIPFLNFTEAYLPLIRAGIAPEDLDYLEFIPYGLSPEEAMHEIERRKSATGTIPPTTDVVYLAEQLAENFTDEEIVSLGRIPYTESIEQLREEIARKKERDYYAKKVLQ